MGVTSLLPRAFLFLLGLQCVHGFVFSCQEVKGKLMNSDESASTTYACVVPEYNFTAYDGIERVYAQVDKVSFELADIMGAPGYCVQRPGGVSTPWKIVGDPPFDADCSQQFTLIYTSTLMPIVRAEEEEGVSYRLSGADSVTLVSPRAGMRIESITCSGGGAITVYAGAGSGVAEFRYVLATYTCATVPNWIVSLDNVLTISTDADAFYSLRVSSDYQSEVNLYPGDRVAILSSGRSDNLHEAKDRLDNTFGFNASEPVRMRMQATLSLDEKHPAIVQYWVDHTNMQLVGPSTGATYNSATVFILQYFVDSGVEVWDSGNNLVIDLTIDKMDPPTTTTPRPPATTTKKPAVKPGEVNPNGYCGCGMKNDFATDGTWKFGDIWHDLIFIIDVSAGMGKAVGEVTGLVEQICQFLTTDPSAAVYSRIGVIAMSKTPQVIYNLNMTSDDSLDSVKVTQSVSFDFGSAFAAALQMFNDGAASIGADRAHVRQVIYYISNSDPDGIPNALDLFKASGGHVIVNDFSEEDEVERPGLQKIASDGYYFTDLQDNYAASYPPLCELNCFCFETDAYNGGDDEARVQARGGCYHVNPAGVTFAKARANCAKTGNGKIAAPHDAAKEYFLNSRVSAVIKPRQPFWIGASTQDGGQWTFEDGSTDPYTHWDPNEGFDEDEYCAYEVQTTGLNTIWHAQNCMAGYPSVCEMAPCSVGYAGCY